MKYEIGWWVSVITACGASALVAFISAWFIFLYVVSLAGVSYFSYQTGKRSNSITNNLEGK